MSRDAFSITPFGVEPALASDGPLEFSLCSEADDCFGVSEGERVSLLQSAEYISQGSTTSKAEPDKTSYMWWMWLSRPQCTVSQYATDGTIPGYTETIGDTVHKHHRVHNAPDSCINLHIHTCWHTQTSSDIYNATTPTYLLAWKLTMPQILRNSGTMGQTFSSIYYRCAGDISIEFNPTFNGQRANDAHLRNLFGPTIGTWLDKV
eukprot:813935-Amphidinium_carterae.3